MNTDRLAGELLALCDGDESVGRAIAFARERHAGQTRLDGEPHIDHTLRVGIGAARYARAHLHEHTAALATCGVLHDTLEDTPTTDAELVSRFGGEIARVVRAVSHEEEEEPDERYLGRVAASGRFAILVKRFDRLDNLDSLSRAPAAFRMQKLAEVCAALPIWERIDPEGAVQIRTVLGGVR